VDECLLSAPVEPPLRPLGYEIAIPKGGDGFTGLGLRLATEHG
jgi:hypothetical protein